MVGLAGVMAVAVGVVIGTTTASIHIMDGTTVATVVIGEAIGTDPWHGHRWAGASGQSQVAGVMAQVTTILTSSNRWRLQWSPMTTLSPS